MINTDTQRTRTIPAGFGCWDVTQYPYGGDFTRMKHDTEISNIRDSARMGEVLGDCEISGRRGVRTVCVNVRFLK